MTTTTAILSCIIILLMPAAAIASQFIGNHKSLTGARIAVSLLSVALALLISGIWGLSVPAWAGWTALVLASVIAGAQQQWLGAKAVRLTLCGVLASAGLVALGAYITGQFLANQEERERNSLFVSSAAEEYFGIPLPDYDVVSYEQEAADGGGFHISATLRFREQPDDFLFEKAALAVRGHSDAVSYRADEFYRLVQDRYEVNARKDGPLLLLDITTR